MKSVFRKTKASPVLSAAALLCFAAANVAFGADVLTYKNDTSRTGLNPAESVLTPSNVISSGFGKIFSHSVDGQIYAQPLYLSNVFIPANAFIASSGLHNVLFVATEHDSLYAFDADDLSGGDATPLWHTSFINLAAGVTSVPSDGTGVNCGDLTPEIGITSTPVIDQATGTIYLIAKTKETTPQQMIIFVQRLHALDIATGLEKPGSPVEITAQYDGSGLPNDGSNHVLFDPLKEGNRPGLLLTNGLLYLSFASHCDIDDYHGWLLAYDASTLNQTGVYNTSPDGYRGGIWMGGGGPVVDQSGDVYFATGNGDFNVDHAGRDYGDSFLRITNQAGTLSVADYLTPFDQDYLNNGDIDLGSGAVLALPDQSSGGHTHLLVGVGKEGTIYLIDRDGMGGYDGLTDHCVQTIPGGIGGSFTSPAYFNSGIYFGEDNNYGPGYLKSYVLSSGLLGTSPSHTSNHIFNYPGTNPSISSNGASSSGIVWGIDNGNGGTAILYAFDATNVTTEIYNSNQASGSRDHPGNGIKFSVPTVVNGKVYVGTQSTVAAYGLLACPPAGPVAVASNGPLPEGATLQLTTAPVNRATYSWTGPNGFASALRNPSIANVTTAASGTYNVTITVSGCASVSGSVDVTIVRAGTALKFFTITPCRLVDTRNAPGTYGAPALQGNGSQRTFPVTSQCGVPAGAAAVAVNLAVISPTGQGDLRVFAAGQAAPNASSINFRAGRTRANNAIVPLTGPTPGSITVQCDIAGGTTDFAADIDGYFQYVP